jgi:hypothetical protein
MASEDKRYQVFISSTYQDLQEERQEVIQALLELDCIPSGMELFPAANDDQWTLIKKVIDDCDYYLVIVAGRYGSVNSGGTSFTEMEYRYALEKGKPIISFIHKNPGLLPANRCEDDHQKKQKLETFRTLVQNKMCRFWESPAELGSQVSRSLIKLIKSNPAIGWVRADLVPDKSAIEEILMLKRQIEELETSIKAIRTTAPEGTHDLSQADDLTEINFTYQIGKYGFGTSMTDSFLVTWDGLFSTISPLMIHEATDIDLKRALDQFVEDVNKTQINEDLITEGLQAKEFKVSDDDFQTIKVQFRALGLITKSVKQRSIKDTSTYWTLTPFGDTLMTKLRAVQKPKVKLDSSNVS